MYCTKCGKKIDDDSNFCASCGAEVPKTPVPSMLEDEPKRAAVCQPNETPQQTSDSESSLRTDNVESSVFVSDNEEEKTELSEETPDTQNQINSSDLHDLQENAGEKTILEKFQKLTPKKKLLLLAIPIVILLVVLIVSLAGGTVSDDDVIGIAKYEVSQRIFSKGEPVLTDAKIVDKDNHNRFIVTMTQDGTFNNYWAVWVEFDKTGDYYHTYCDFHGAYNSKYGTLSQDGLVELFQTNPDFRWGEDTWIREESN